MKKRNLFLSLALLGSLFSCGNNSFQPSNNISLSEDIYAEEWQKGYQKLDDSNLTEEIKDTQIVRVFYYRDNRDYFDWDFYYWESNPISKAGFGKDFTKYSDFGLIVELEIGKDIDPSTTTIGFKFRTGGDNWTSADVDKNRFIEIPATCCNGIHEVYIREGIEDIFFNEQDALTNNISLAEVMSKDTFRVFLHILDGQIIDVTKLSIYKNDEEIKNYTTRVIANRNIVFIDFNNETIDIANTYKVKYDFGDKVAEKKVMMNYFYNKDEFNELYYYDGDDLGVTFDEEKTTTTFKLWAPISKRVSLNIYDKGTPSTSNKPIKTILMEKQEKGVWSTTLNEYLHGKYYTYIVENEDAINEVVDPYAKSCGINGKIGMIVDFDVINEELGWNQVTRPETIVNNVDASIYEIHVRDMTIDPTSGVDERYRGKFLGLAQENTSYTENGKTVSTGLSHIKELGVTHVQIQPFYDYNSVDENYNNQYNWGYDPVNYNCLEGSYSTNPSDGLNRIKEFKMMMKAMLKNGIQVNMDVVYNHTAENDNTNFEKIFPGYYHRLTSNYDYSNGSGCGNEMATENKMYRKFVVDSCKFLLKEYKLSGFRFDLMALLDTETMEEVYQECAKIYDKVMIYGEPWGGGTTTLSVNQQTDQSTIRDIDGVVGAFNDKIRDSIRGSNSLSLGWVQGNIQSVTGVINGIQGKFTKSFLNPNLVINYSSCHDNYTLFDQIERTIPEDRVFNDVYKQADAILFLGQGVPFIQEGEEFLRTKKAGIGSEVHNSYKAGDHVNKMDYSLKILNEDMVEYFKELISFRKNIKLFRLNSSEDITNKMTLFDTENDLICYTLEDENEKYYIIHSINEFDNYQLDGDYSLIFNNEGFVYSNEVINLLKLEKNHSYVLKLVK